MHGVVSIAPPCVVEFAIEMRYREHKNAVGA